jgi:RNase P subunit RPR2
MHLLGRYHKRLYFDGKRKECLNGHIKELSEFYPHHKKGVYLKGDSCYYRPYCKECHKAITSRKRLEKKRDLFPNSFWDCDNCDHIVSVQKDTCDKCGFRRFYVL